MMHLCKESLNQRISNKQSTGELNWYNMVNGNSSSDWDNHLKIYLEDD